MVIRFLAILNFCTKTGMDAIEMFTVSHTNSLALLGKYLDFSLEGPLLFPTIDTGNADGSGLLDNASRGSRLGWRVGGWTDPLLHYALSTSLSLFGVFVGGCGKLYCGPGTTAKGDVDVIREVTHIDTRRHTHTIRKKESREGDIYQL